MSTPSVAEDRGLNSVGPWLCFHCGETFREHRCAREHFGSDEGAMPACLIKGSERGLLGALRDAEDSSQKAWDALHGETTDVHRALYAAHSRHGQALRSAEEVGYARGLEDGRLHQSPSVAELEAENARLREALETARGVIVSCYVGMGVGEKGIALNLAFLDAALARETGQ